MRTAVQGVTPFVRLHAAGFAEEIECGPGDAPGDAANLLVNLKRVLHIIGGVVVADDQRQAAIICAQRVILDDTAKIEHAHPCTARIFQVIADDRHPVQGAERFGQRIHQA